MDQYGLMILNGLTWGMTVFLTASGLSLVFGILHILNFAHSGFVMLGAYLAYSLLTMFSVSSFWLFLAVTIACAVGLSLLGVLVDKLVFARLRGVSESYSLIATYALLLLCQGVVKVIWGINFLSVPPPPELAGAIELGTTFIPSYVLFVITAGVLTFITLDYLVHRTEIGKTVQSVAIDPWMASILGINVQLVLVGTVALGVALAGAAGAILSANQSLSPEMGSTLIIQAFGVIIVGGMGNIRGAFLASILLGVITAFGDRIFAEIPGLFFYLALIAILLLRPQGLLKGLR
jgi:branched-chain amino acid transport system permease protein